MRNLFALACSLIASIGCFNVTAANYNNIHLTGHVALITDMSQAMEYVWTEGDIDAESLRQGVFVQVLGDYYITDGNVYFRKTGVNGTYGYSYNWAQYGDGSLAKYGSSYMNTSYLEETNSQFSYSWSGRVIYFKFDPTSGILYDCTLRDYIGHYDWHDFYLQGYARTLETDPETGYYDWEKANNDPLSRYLYNVNNPSEYRDSIPLYFNENPYQIDGPCVLMYKGEPWPLKLTNIEVLDETNAEIRYAQPGTPWTWNYDTDPQGDTINLQAGVYIFFLSYRDQRDKPLSLEAMRCDLGQFEIIGNDTLMPAESYEYHEVPIDDTGSEIGSGTGSGTGTGTVIGNSDIYLKSYYSYQTKVKKYKYKDYVTPYGNSRKRVEYWDYQNHNSSTYYDYPVEGLAEELGYSGCIAIPYGAFNTNQTHTNHPTLIIGSTEKTLTAPQKDLGVPVIIYRTSNGTVSVTYITYEKYQSIMADVAPIQRISGPAIIYDLKGNPVNESDMQRGRIYIKNRKPIIIR